MKQNSEVMPLKFNAGIIQVLNSNNNRSAGAEIYTIYQALRILLESPCSKLEVLPNVLCLIYVSRKQPYRAICSLALQNSPLSTVLSFFHKHVCQSSHAQFLPKGQKTQSLADAQLLTRSPVCIVCWYAILAEKRSRLFTSTIMNYKSLL